MKTVLPLFTIAYGAVAGLFGIAGVVLMGFAFLELWTAVIEPEGQTLPARAATAIESIGLVAVALVALEMAQTVAEEEVVRRVHVSAPTRVRRYLSRFRRRGRGSGLSPSRSCRHSTSGRRRRECRKRRRWRGSPLDSVGPLFG
jgi:hypothetical protein